MYPETKKRGNTYMLHDTACSLTAIAILLLASAPVALSQTGSISGTIAGDDGKPLAGVITSNRTSPPAASGRAVAGANGAFTIANLPAGTYALCASVENLGYLDPCAWSAAPPTVQIAAGQAVTGFRLVVKKGTTLQVRLNDPDKILGQKAAPKQVAPHVLLGVFTPRRLFQPLQLAGTDASGRNHQGTVPLDNTPASLHVTGRGVRILDESNVEVGPSGVNIGVKPNNGNAPKVITFTVRDPNKH